MQQLFRQIKDEALQEILLLEFVAERLIEFFCVCDLYYVFLLNYGRYVIVEKVRKRRYFQLSRIEIHNIYVTRVFVPIM